MSDYHVITSASVAKLLACSPRVR